MSEVTRREGPFDIDQVLKEVGGVEQIRERIRSYEEVCLKLKDMEGSLTKQHPHRWVALGTDDSLLIGDSLEAVCQAARDRGLESHQFAVEYLDPNPPILIV